MTEDIRATISSLEKLQLDGFIFRGHENFKYVLQPSAFRTQSINKMKSNFEIPSQVVENWQNSQVIQNVIQSWTHRGEHYTHHPTVKNLKSFCFYLMLYNHELHRYVNNNPTKVSDKDKKWLLLRDKDFWRSEDTFQHLFSHYLQAIINRTDLMGNLIQKAQPYEDLAGVDETLPQHYGIPTAALDWSFNFRVALYFAIAKGCFQTKYCKIYALKLHETTSPVKLINKSALIDNIRAVRQEGVFSYFTSPCSYYLCNNEFPSIDYFNIRYKNKLDDRTFELQEFLIECTEKNLLYLNDLLKESGINKQYLFPDDIEIIA